MDKRLKWLYLKYRNLGYPARRAIYNASVILKWEFAEYAGKVRLDVIPDDETTFDDLCGDTFSPQATGLSLERCKREEKRFCDKVRDEGMWGIVGMVKTMDIVCERCGHENVEWERVCSTWGLVGDEWRNGDYNIAVMAETLSRAGWDIPY